MIQKNDIRKSDTYVAPTSIEIGVLPANILCGSFEIADWTEQESVL